MTQNTNTNTKEELIEQIKELMNLDIDLSSFQLDDLINTRDDLLAKKANERDDINQWFDNELYDKLKG